MPTDVQQLHQSPLHAIAVADELATKADGCVIVIDVVVEHPFASVTV